MGLTIGRPLGFEEIDLREWAHITSDKDGADDGDDITQAGKEAFENRPPEFNLPFVGIGGSEFDVLDVMIGLPLAGEHDLTYWKASLREMLMDELIMDHDPNVIKAAELFIFELRALCNDAEQKLAILQPLP